MDLSFIVGAFNRPNFLRTCLSSIVCQTHTNIEIIVVDNAVDQVYRDAHRKICRMDERIYWFPSYLCETSRISCYYGGDFGAQYLSRSEYVCFPSDDSYYLPYFAERLLAKAKEGFDFVACDFLFGGTENDDFKTVETKPEVGAIGKTNFILKRKQFIPFPGKHPEGQDSCSDGLLAEELVRRGVAFARVAQTLMVHIR